VTKPEIMELAKCNTIFSSKYPILKEKKYNNKTNVTIVISFI